jgi:aryl-alcohol dehydrogenase-like predicted oxidoreductase
VSAGVWGQMSDDPADRGLSAAQIAKQIDASLARLRTEYVDLIELTPDTLAAIDEALGDAPVKEPRLAPLARGGVTHR